MLATIVFVKCLLFRVSSDSSLSSVICAASAFAARILIVLFFTFYSFVATMIGE